MLNKSWNCLYFHYVIAIFIVSSFLAHGFCQYKRQYIFTQKSCGQPWGSQMSDKKFVLIYYLWMVFRKSPPVNSPPVNPPPPTRVRVGVGQFTGRQFDRGEFTGGGN